jgi:hypothetical protein
MKWYHIVCMLLGILFQVSVLGGCASVTSQRPLPQAVDAKEQARFEGEWVSDGQVIYLRFGEDGVGRFAGVDWKQGRFQLDEGEIIVTKGPVRSFLSARIKENGTWEQHYYFAEYLFADSGDLVLWLPNVRAFADAVAKGKLAGVVEKGKHTQSVMLTSPPEKLLAFLSDPANSMVFDYREPMILRKLVLTAASGEMESDCTREGCDQE